MKKNRVTSKVEGILSIYKETRGSDKKLLLQYWASQGLHLTPEQKQTFLEKCDIAESITRARRDIQQQGKYLPSKEVEQARFDMFQQYKNEYGNNIKYNF